MYCDYFFSLFIFQVHNVMNNNPINIFLIGGLQRMVVNICLKNKR